ncbi:MAG: class I SAM-dependent methyltransferase [candidate division Zixibacteria bacterium HGW-Zixibacteria-1]|nr:MAG: class I SAM-dependent methyltransferase [candidate division Zixibacteria bacterium HGW-Zixibacteria-1]
MDQYYSEKLSAAGLKRCYEIAPPCVEQYLKAEINHVLEKLRSSDVVLELGCGYGRVIKYLCPHVKTVFGIDTSMASLKMARYELHPCPNIHLARMNAITLGFGDNVFDMTICIQNGLSAFKVDQHALIKEAARVTRPGGKVLLSSYSDKFWDDRLEWFRMQSAEGLLGPIDNDRTGNGIIACKDGFKATTVSREDFELLAQRARFTADITEVDNSSIFCELTV